MPLQSLRTSSAEAEIVFQDSSRALAEILKGCGFVSLDSKFRADTASSPHRHHWSELCEAVNARLPELDPIEIVQYGFLKMAEAYPRPTLEAALGKSAREFLTLGLASGLCWETEEGISLGGLVCFAFPLPDGESVFCLADLPSNAAPQSPPQVYAGVDSFLVTYRLLTAPEVCQPVIELGSGAALQSIALLKSWPGCPLAVGIEINERARVVSRWNAIMNGVEDRFVIVATSDEAVSVLDGRLIKLVFGNPPHYALPKMISFGGRSVSSCEVFGALGNGGERGTDVVLSLLRPLIPVLDPHAEVVLLGDYPGDIAAPSGVVELGAAVQLPVCRYVSAFQRSGCSVVPLAEHAARTAEILLDSLGDAAPDELAPSELAQQLLHQVDRYSFGSHVHYGFAELRANDELPWMCPPVADHDQLLEPLESAVLGPLFNERFARRDY